jgi:hypothetical protein
MELCRETVVFCLFDVRRHAVPFDPAVHMAINTTDIVCALESLKYVMDEFPLERHLGEALYGIYLRLLESM